MQALAVLLGLFLATFAGFALFTSNPFGGEPMVRVALPQPTPGEKPAMAAPAYPSRWRRSQPSKSPGRTASKRP